MRKTHCIKCGQELTKENRIAFQHTTGTRYMCAHCASIYNCAGSYSTENHLRVSKETTTGATISKEMELPRKYAYTLSNNERATLNAYMTSQGWLCTPDGSVYQEWKTPIYNSLQSYSKISKTFEKLAQVSKWRDDMSYGTHTNVGHARLDIRVIRKFYESLFCRLYETMKSDESRVKELYGRTFTGYAQAYNSSLAPRSGSDGYAQNESFNANEHVLAINVQHKTHIEFRLNKYISFEQDNKVSKYAIDTVLACVEFCDMIRTNRDTYTGEELKEKNRAAADKASRKIDNIYRKYVGLPRVNKTA